MRHLAYKREKYTFINANIEVINTILKVNRDNWHGYPRRNTQWELYNEHLQNFSTPFSVFLKINLTILMLTGQKTVQKGGFGPKYGFFPKNWPTAKV